jgi:hypothetical protein
VQQENGKNYCDSFTQYLLGGLNGGKSRKNKMIQEFSPDTFMNGDYLVFWEKE